MKSSAFSCKRDSCNTYNEQRGPRRFPNPQFIWYRSTCLFSRLISGACSGYAWATGPGRTKQTIMGSVFCVPPPQCSPLPVSFRSFQRLRQWRRSVQLRCHRKRSVKSQREQTGKSMMCVWELHSQYHLGAGTHCSQCEHLTSQVPTSPIHRNSHLSFLASVSTLPCRQR